MGPTQYIVSTYPCIRSFNKVTGQPDGVLDIDGTSFAGGAINGFPLNNADVYLIYHPFLKRWFFSSEINSPAALLPPLDLEFIVSEDATITPTTKWSIYKISRDVINPSDPTGGLDYNQQAFDQNAWYNGVGTFNDAGDFIGSSLTVVSNSSIAAGAPNITVFPNLFNNPIFFVDEGFACPANNFDKDPQFGYFVWPIFNADGTGNTIQMYRILDGGDTKSKYLSGTSSNTNHHICSRICIHHSSCTK